MLMAGPHTTNAHHSNFPSVVLLEPTQPCETVVRVREASWESSSTDRQIGAQCSCQPNPTTMAKNKPGRRRDIRRAGRRSCCGCPRRTSTPPLAPRSETGAAAGDYWLSICNRNRNWYTKRVSFCREPVTLSCTRAGSNSRNNG